MKQIQQYLLLLTGLLISINTYSQDAQFRVISSQGSVKHQSVDGQVNTNIIPGSKLAATGTLIVEDSSEVKLICRDKPQIINQAGMYDLEELFMQSAKKSMSFTGRFWKFVMDGLTKSDSKNDLKKYHQNYMSVSGGIKGYSTENNDVNILTPFAGKMTRSKFEIKWQTDQTGPYRVQLFSGSERDLLFEEESTDRSISFTTEDYDMIPGYDYFLKVITAEGGYDEIAIQMVEMNEDRIARRLNSLVDYESADQKEKKWMRAVILEMEGFQNEAQTIYDALIADYPEDGFIRKNYMLFLTRNNQLEIVNSIF